jgi:hypothetical protein
LIVIVTEVEAGFGNISISGCGKREIAEFFEMLQLTGSG